MFDSKQKDLMIDWLVNQIGKNISFPSKEMAKEFCVQDAFIRLFLKQLAKKELIEYSEMGSGYVRCYPTMDLYDFHRLGGFTAIEDGLLKNIEKLDLELKELKSQFPKKVEMFANLTSTLSTVALSATKLFGYLTL